MKSPVSLSVIIPVYNVEKYLQKCLESVVNQTFQDIEIVIVNDGSTDSSGKICDEFAEKDNRIKVIHQKNAGVSAARNYGIDLATGNYITFVDSDDWLEPEMYEKMSQVVESEVNPDVVMCDFTNIKKNTTETISADIPEGLYNKKEIIDRLYPTLLVTENFGRLPIVSVWNCLFKKSLIKENKIAFDASLMYSEDYLFMAEVMTNAQSFYYLKGRYFYNYLQYEASRSKKFQKEWWVNLVYLNDKLKKLLANNKDYDFTRHLKLQLMHSVLFVLAGIYGNNNMNFFSKLKSADFIMHQKEISEAFKNLNLERQTPKMRFVLYLIKYRLSTLYAIVLKMISVKKWIGF